MRKHYGPRLRTLHCLTDQAVTAAVAQMGLTAAQGRIIGFLSRSPQPPCPHDIEEVFRLSHPTVSGLLQRLEKKEFIALRPDPEDKRCKRIHLLPKGEQCNQHIHQTIDAIEKQLLRDFSDEEQAQFSRLLDRAIINIGGDPHRPFRKKEEEIAK